MNIEDLIDDLTKIERDHGGKISVTDQQGHEIDRVELDSGSDDVTVIARLVAR